MENVEKMEEQYDSDDDEMILEKNINGHSEIGFWCNLCKNRKDIFSEQHKHKNKFEVRNHIFRKHKDVILKLEKKEDDDDDNEDNEDQNRENYVTKDKKNKWYCTVCEKDSIYGQNNARIKKSNVIQHTKLRKSALKSFIWQKIILGY